MTLTNADIAELTDLRRELHRHPEVSGEEVRTADRIRAALNPLSPDQVITGLGGHGLAAVFVGAGCGPTVLFRCELDALPILETGMSPHRSTIAGKGHLCGHDGHMAILTGLARLLSRQRPERGRVVLLFQPAEETGEGAKAIIEDAKFETIAPDFAFSLHNMPGVPFGQVSLAPGPVNCASRGLSLTLTGATAHASQPETGISPMTALCELMPRLTALGHGKTSDPDFALVTITHARMGEPAFGITPGEATLFATLRTLTDDRMTALCETAHALIDTVSAENRLSVTHDYHDIFAHCENHPEATGILSAALDRLGIPHNDTGLPWRPSEDFGRYGQSAKAAMLFLGAGTDTPDLHNPDYDFPDDLIPVGAQIFETVTRDILG